MKRKLGISTSSVNEPLFSCGLFSCIEYCKSELPLPDSFETLEKDAKKLKELSEKYGVDIRSLHIPFASSDYFKFEPAAFDESVRDETFENTKRMTNIFSPLGIEIIVVHGSLRVLPEERSEKLPILVTYLQKLCDYCKPLNIRVAVETLKPRCLGNGLAEHLYLMENVKRENIGICFDTNHLLLEDNIEFIKGAGQYIITTHFSDFDGVDERHWFPGKGINDWKEITGRMSEKGYAGPWVFEVSFENSPPTSEDYFDLVNSWNEIIR